MPTARSNPSSRVRSNTDSASVMTMPIVAMPMASNRNTRMTTSSPFSCCSL